MTPIPVFYIEATDRSKLHLRRYTEGPCPLSPGQYSYHDIMIPIGEGPARGINGFHGFGHQSRIISC